MTLREMSLAATGAVLLLAGARMASHNRPTTHELPPLSRCSVPVTVLNGDAPEKSRPVVVVFHGFSGNRRIMNLLGRGMAAAGARVYLVDLPGHGDSTERFLYSRAEHCALEVLEELESRGEIAPENTVLVGHSMGAGIVVRLADEYPVAATIAISAVLRMPPEVRPAEITLLEMPRRMPSNLLILVGQLDLPPARQMAEKLLAAAGGERTAPEDFRQRRAVRRVILPLATHTSVLFDRRVAALAADWIRNLEPEQTPVSAAPSALPVLGGLAGLAGLLLLFPAAASFLAGVVGGKVSTTRQDKLKVPSAALILGVWGVAGLVAVSVQARTILLVAVIPSRGGDYLASIALVGGALLLAALWKTGRTHRCAPTLAWFTDFRGMAAGAALGLITILAFGAWLDWQFTDAWPNAARWEVFGLLLPFFLLYLLAEEAALGPPTEKRIRRLALFFGLRAALWLAIVFGLVVLHSGEVLPILLALYLALFSLLQRLGADAVRRRTGSPAGAALFSAILAAWFIAAVFPLG